MLLAVTLEGTVIHKSGLITGGRSTQGIGKKFDEKDVQGLMRARDNLKAQLRELAKQKPRGQTDENLISEISRLDSMLVVARDDLVRPALLFPSYPNGFHRTHAIFVSKVSKMKLNILRRRSRKMLLN